MSVHLRTAYRSKLRLQALPSLSSTPSSHPAGYRIMDIDLLIDFVSTCPCPRCSSPCFGCADDKTKVQVREDINGIASCIVFTCASCRHSLDFHSSKKVDTGVYESNRRFPVAITSIGRHYVQGKRFLANMNIPPPQTFESWKKHVKRIHQVTKEVAEVTMQKAATEVRRDATVADITVSLTSLTLFVRLSSLSLQI